MVIMFQNHANDFEGQYKYEGCPENMDGFSIPISINPDWSFSPIKSFHYQKMNDKYYTEGFDEKDINKKFYTAAKNLTKEPLYHIPETFFTEEDGYSVPKSLMELREKQMKENEDTKQYTQIVKNMYKELCDFWVGSKEWRKSGADLTKQEDMKTIMEHLAEFIQKTIKDDVLVENINDMIKELFGKDLSEKERIEKDEALWNLFDIAADWVESEMNKVAKKESWPDICAYAAMLRAMVDKGILQTDPYPGKEDSIIIYYTDLDKEEYGTEEGWVSQSIWETAREISNDRRCGGTQWQELLDTLNEIGYTPVFDGEEFLCLKRDDSEKNDFTIMFNPEPITTDSFFDSIIKKLEKQDAFRKISKSALEIDYMSSLRLEAEPIEDDDFWITTETDFGGSEGIYTDVYMNRYRENHLIKKNIGTIKTLQDSWDALEWMSVIGVRFRKEAAAFIKENKLRFVRKGYGIVEPKEPVMDKYRYKETDLRLKTGVVYATDKVEDLIGILKGSKNARLINFNTREDITGQYT